MAAKIFKTIDEQIEILRSKGMVFEDYDKAREILLRENYFFLNGYRSPFLQTGSKRFIDGSTFEELYALFSFDRFFRNIIFKNILIVEKWPGVLVHPDQKGAEPSLTDYVLSYLNDKGDYIPEKELTFTPAPCNRLDRNTSGTVIFGKNFESLREMNEMIREGKVKKYYNALVKGRIKDGLYTGYISKNENENISRVYDKEMPNTKKVAMEVKTIQSNGAFSFLEIDLNTGRSHQIRAHLSHLGNPIIGDIKYGDKKLNSFFDNKFGLNYQFLYAYKLIFKGGEGKLAYLKNKTVAEALPPMFKKVKREVFKFAL